MPVVTSCPDCARKLRIPDELLGKKVRCRGCKGVFIATSGAAAPPPEERIQDAPRDSLPTEETFELAPLEAPHVRKKKEEDLARQEVGDELPRRRRKREEDDFGEEDPARQRDQAGWRRVAKGLTFVVISVATTVAVYLISFVLSIVVVLAMAPDPTASVFIGLRIVDVLLKMASAGVKVYAHYLCLSVPNKPGSNLRTLALVTFGLFTTSEVFVVLQEIVGLAFGLSDGPPDLSLGGRAIAAEPFTISGLSLLRELSYLAGFFVFGFFLRGVAIAVKRRKLAESLRVLLIVAAAVAGPYVLLQVATTGINIVSSWSESSERAMDAIQHVLSAGQCLTCVGVIAGLGVGIWYIVLLVQVQIAVAEYARRG